MRLLKAVCRQSFCRGALRAPAAGITLSSLIELRFIIMSGGLYPAGK